MKAISLWQPCASAIVIGAKKIETRNWWTPHRGELAIHAALKDTPELREFFTWKVCDPLRKAGYEKFDELPRGAIIATCRLVECLQTQDVDGLTEQERNFGDFAPGRYAWILEDVRTMKPVPFRGAQSLFNWPNDETPRLPGL